MKFIITGKNMEVSPRLRQTIEKKLGKLDRFFTPITEVIVTLSSQRERKKIEVTIPVKGTVIRSEQTSDDMLISLDLACEVLERQLLKYKNKIIDRHRESDNSQPAFAEGAFADDTKDDGAADTGEAGDGGDIRIIRTKRFGLKPMFPEDACVQMELLGHDFFVFENADTEQVNVVYKRKDGAYGLIEPEF